MLLDGLPRTCSGAALVGAALFSFSFAQAVAAPSPYIGNPPLSHTGGWGEPTCHVCHSDGELDSPEVTLKIDGFPTRYTPGAIYPIVVSVEGPGQILAGFQASLRFLEGPSRGLQAGHLEAMDGRVVVQTGALNSVQYAHHTREGTQLVSEERGAWQILWRAPDAEQSVILHLAVNSANGDNSPFSDLIRTSESVSQPSDDEWRKLVRTRQR